MALPDWDDLRVLLSVVQTGSFSRTANALGLTQPTVSRRVARLEKRLSQPPDDGEPRVILIFEDNGFGSLVPGDYPLPNGNVMRIEPNPEIDYPRRPERS